MEKAGPRRMRVQANMTPKARSRPDRSRETGSPRSRRVEKVGCTTPMHEARRRAREELLAEANRKVRKEARIMEMTKAALMKEIQEGVRDFRVIDKIKRMRQDEDMRIEECVRQNF